MILGIVGQPSAGKDTVARYLETKGFRHISTGDFIRSEMKAAGLPLDRHSASKFSAQRRAEIGPQYPISLFIDQLAGEVVVSGLRHTAEAEFLKSHLNKEFILVAVVADPEVRWRRSISRGDARDNLSFEEFKQVEAQESAGATHQTSALIEMADIRIDNSGTENQLFPQIDAMIETSMPKK